MTQRNTTHIHSLGPVTALILCHYLAFDQSASLIQLRAILNFYFYTNKNLKFALTGFWGFGVLALLHLPKCSTDLNYGPCPPARGLV